MLYTHLDALGNIGSKLEKPDIELGALRQRGKKSLVVPVGLVPIHQAENRGYISSSLNNMGFYPFIHLLGWFIDVMSKQKVFLPVHLSFYWFIMNREAFYKFILIFVLVQSAKTSKNRILFQNFNCPNLMR